jgi:hypothetical protein
VISIWSEYANDSFATKSVSIRQDICLGILRQIPGREERNYIIIHYTLMNDIKDSVTTSVITLQTTESVFRFR